ncbi:MAG: TonB-dependent receptor [Cytophagales bacterium]|nr:TonB-dependent receptor [Cytophagales bacterium]
MKKFIAIALLLCVSQAAWAQFTVSGLVTSGGEPLPGATVVLQGTFKGTVTDPEGRYELRNLSAGKHTLAASFVGYQKAIQDLELTGNQTLDFTLERAAYVADEVVVSATRATTKSGTTFTNLSREEIAKQNLGQDLPFLLNQTPSVVVNSDAGAGVGYTGIRIRGSDPTRINVTVNGIPLNDAESHGVFWVNMPDFASSVDNIQIQRGVGTSTNGAASFGATVNVQTNSLNEKPYAEFTNGYGSFNTWRHTAKVGTGLINGRWAFDGRLSRITSDGFVDRASSNLKSFFLSGGYYHKGTMLKANVFSGREITYQAWNGVPEARLRNDREGMLAFIDRNGLNETQAQNLLTSDARRYNFYQYDNQVDDYQQDHYQFFFTQEINRRWTANAALHYTRGRGFFEEFVYDDALASYNISDVAIGADTIRRTDLVRRRWLDNHFYGAVWSVAYNSLKRLSVTVGGGWNHYQGKHFGEVIWARFAGNSNVRQRYYDNDATKADFNTYAKANYDFTDKLNLFVDLQYRRIGYTFVGFDQNLQNVQQTALFHFFNPKAGLTYRLSPGSSVYASYSVANREPTRNDFVESTPQSRPQAENLRNLEVGFRRQSKDYAFSANYYLMDYRNQLVLTGQVNDVGAYTRTNIARSYRTGVELEGSVRLNRRTVAANATFSRNKVRDFREFLDNFDTGEQEVRQYRRTDIAFSPNLIAAGTLTYAPAKGLEISWLSKYVGSQYLDNTSNAARRLDAFFVNDLRLNYVWKPKFVKEIGLNALVNNVFNHAYEPNGYTFGYLAGGAEVRENFYYPQAGTNFLLSATVKF